MIKATIINTINLAPIEEIAIPIAPIKPQLETSLLHLRMAQVSQTYRDNYLL
jgi:hypothetical protein